MKTEYKRDLNHNYLAIHEDIELDTSSYQVRMLAGNAIPSLLKCQFHGVEGKIVFHYDITSKQSITVLYEGKLLKEKDLKIIFGSFIQVMEQMAEYLLNPGQILLQPEYMYMDINRKEVLFCYLPGKEGDVKEQLQALLEYILPKIDHDDKKAVSLGYNVYRWILEDNFRLEQVKEELYREINKETLEEKPKKKEVQIEAGKIPSSKTDEAEKFDYENENLEALFDFSKEIIMEDSGKKHLSDADDKKYKGKKDSFNQKIYIIVPVVGTVIIMAILAANMMGILPWIQVEILLMGVVLLAMLLSLICFFLGKIRDKKEREKTEWEWKQKVKKHKETAENNVIKEVITTSQEISDFNKEIKKKETQEWNLEKDFQDGDTNDYGETVVLSAAAVRGPATMVSKEPGEFATIYLKDDLTVIGKLESAVDAIIPVATVSRLHAKVRKRENEYYLADLNSRNGTSVNGRMLAINEEYLLQDEDEVDFAEARYIFLK